MKRALFFVSMLATMMVTFAQESGKPNALVVRYGDEVLYSILLSHRPEMRIENGQAVVEADGTYYSAVSLTDRPLSYVIPLSENMPYSLSFDEMTWEGDSYSHNAVTDISSVEKSAPVFSLQGGKVNVKDQKAGEILSVYSTDGKLVKSVKVGKNGMANVRLPENDGVYIVKCGKANFKILKK